MEVLFQKWGFRSGGRFVSCLRGGGRGKFSAGWRCTGGRLQVHFPESNQALAPGRRGVVTPSLQIRQSMGWTKVCGTARSGIWVLKGNARTRFLPANLDHLRVGWRKRVYIRDRLGYARARLSVFIPVWTWSSRQTTN